MVDHDIVRLHLSNESEHVKLLHERSFTFDYRLQGRTAIQIKDGTYGMLPFFQDQEASRCMRP